MTDFGGRHKISHQDGGGDEIDTTGLAGRVNYVDRGEIAAYDYTLSDLTTDGIWHNLDLSAIVPAGAIAVVLSCRMMDNLTHVEFCLRENENPSNYNILRQNTVVSNVKIMMNGMVSCDSSRIVQYFASSTVWSMIDIVVRGWLI